MFASTPTAVASGRAMTYDSTPRLVSQKKRSPMAQGSSTRFTGHRCATCSFTIK